MGVAVHTSKRITTNLDPSRTTGIRIAFIREMNRRFNDLKRLITKAIVFEDVFGLLDNDGKLIVQQQVTPGFRRFNFPRNSQKLSSFMEWLDRMVADGVLSVANINQVGEGVEGAWTNKYIFDSYKRGVTRARYQLRVGGLDIPSLDATGGITGSMALPFHIDRVGLLYTRTFNELKGITDAMDQQISRILAEGLAEGVHPRTLAKRLNQTITGTGRSLAVRDSLGRTIGAQRRAQMLARTETIRAHAQAQLTEFKNWGVQGVTVEAEFRTAGDDRVCIECSSMEGNVYPIDVAMNIIPVHTSCRCAWIPKIV